MPDFDFLSEAENSKGSEPVAADKNSAAKPADDQFNFDFLSGDAPAAAESEPTFASAEPSDANPADSEPTETVKAAGDAALDFDFLADASPGAHGSAQPTADDPVADALSELDMEAAAAVDFSPTPEMTADTTAALSDDPFSQISEETPASMPTGDDVDLPSQPLETASDTLEPWPESFEVDATPTEELAAELPEVVEHARTDPAEIAAIVGGAMGVALVAPHEVVPVEQPWEPPVIAEEPLPAAPDTSDPAYPAFESLTHHVRQASLLGSIEAVLGWDERCMMPAAGTDNRAEQITLLSGLVHERLTDPRIGDWLARLNESPLAADPHGEAGATIRQIRRQYEKRSKLPKTLVEELAHTAVVGQAAWQEARKNNDYASFAPVLEKMVRLKCEQADALGFAETRYDALLDEFEPGELTSRVTKVLGALRDELVPLVAQIRDGGRSPRLEILERSYPVEMQRAFGRHAAERIGFDFTRGRLDVTAHPFCTGLGPNDCRITTRYDENYFNSAFFGILHEAGHGIYDQGLRADQYGLPLGEAVSMGIHESQSRMWEIMVGRGLPFWRHFYGSARRTFGQALAGVTLGDFYFAVNDVRSSLIRVEADEFTYNLHILIRFELEQALISGELQVADLPAAWNQKYRDYLGLEVPNDADGVLQDIHWSAGLFGYFPTYSLGNLYAAQFYEQADKDLGGLDAQFERGDFQYLKKWLQVNIHRHGQRYTAAELVRRITGRELSHEPLIAHLRRKYELLYSPEAETFVELDVPDVDAGAVEEVEGIAGGVAMHDVGDVGGYALTATPGFDGMAVGGGTAVEGGTFAPTRIRPRPKSSPWAMVIVFGGIVGGGVIGIALGLWILMWWKGPQQGDVLKIRDKLPAWMVPGEVTEEPAPTTSNDSTDSGESSTTPGVAP